MSSEEGSYDEQSYEEEEVEEEVVEEEEVEDEQEDEEGNASETGGGGGDLATFAAESESGDEEERPAEAQPAQEKASIEIQVPHLNERFEDEVHYAKLPNFLSIEPRVFDEQIFEMEAEDDEVMNEGGRSRVKLKVENTIRWRFEFDELGNERKVSNAKLVRYSDNSMALFIGSEAFDVRVVPIENENRRLFIRQGNGLQASAVLATKLVFRPQSMDSSTHHKITKNIAEKVAKAQKVKVLPAMRSDPELTKQMMIKAEEERLKNIARKESQKRRVRQRPYNRSMSGGYLESEKHMSDDENGDSISLSAIKRKYKSTAKDYYQSYSENDGDSFNENRTTFEETVYESEEEEQPSGAFRRVVEDDDDEEE